MYGNSVPYRGPWFGKFMRRYKLSIGVIKRQDFGLTLDVVKALVVRWEVEWKGAHQIRKRSISCVSAAVVIGFCGGLRGEEVFLT